jgi:hypothetical protein
MNVYNILVVGQDHLRGLDEGGRIYYIHTIEITVKETGNKGVWLD